MARADSPKGGGILGNFRVTPAPKAPDPVEVYRNTPEGQDMERLLDLQETGDAEDFARALQEFRRKYPHTMQGSQVR